MKTILLVDDELDFVKVIKVRLEASGFKVITASDGQEGIAKVIPHNPDLIIMDIMMPKMDGIHACGLIKLDKRHKKIPIIMLTASADEVKKCSSQEAGADDFCNKPVDMEELQKKIKNLLNI